MNHKFLRIAVMCVAAQGVLTAGAQAQFNAVRCEVRKLRCDSRYYQCLARCDRRLEAQADPAAQTAQAQHTKCEGSCDTRRSQRMARIENTALCTPDAPSPRQCEAQHLLIDANYMSCTLRCNGLHADQCKSDCKTRCGTESDALDAQVVCKDGRVANPPPANECN